MSSEGQLRVGSVLVSSLRNGVSNELLAVFRDDMMKVKRVPKAEYYDFGEESNADEEDADGGASAYVEMVEFQAPGRHIAARLDIMGITPTVVCDYLECQLHEGRVIHSEKESVIHSEEFLASLDRDIREEIERERSFSLSLSAQDWIERLASTEEDNPKIFGRTVGDRRWLLSQLDYWDERFALRAVLLSFPDSEVVLDMTDLEIGGWVDDARRGALASDAVAFIGAMAGMHAPVVILTEGRTDAEFLNAGLDILYPYLKDLIRFLDYDQKNEGGAGALVRMVRAFAAAGIVNRVIAIFDNDTAAADALRVLDPAKLPSQIQVLRYPPITIAERYPTLGPPNQESPSGSTALADVNGLAGSIEMYLGRDVLTGSDGELRPVQWKSYIPSVGSYQGEIIDKAGTHEAFRAKYKLASSQPGIISHQDWDGVRLIIDAIRDAAQSAFGGLDPTMAV